MTTVLGQVRVVPNHLVTVPYETTEPHVNRSKLCMAGISEAALAEGGVAREEWVSPPGAGEWQSGLYCNRLRHDRGEPHASVSVARGTAIVWGGE